MPSETGDTARAGILFALPEEAAPFRRRPAAVSVQIACSGVGACQAGIAAERLIASASSPLSCLLVCGFAGGLSAEMSPGDLLLATSVLDGTSLSTRQALIPDSRLLAAAESVRLLGTRLHTGTLRTIPRILTTSAEKHRIAAQCRAQAVDMETAGAACAAQKHGIPWLAVRAITDGVKDDLPFDFNALADADGNVDRRRIVQAVVTRPWKIPALVRLGMRSALAAHNLAAFLKAFLEKTK